VIALSVIAIVVIIQLRGVKVGGMFQNIMTYVKLGMIAFFLITPFLFSGSFETSEVSFAPSDSSSSTIFSLSFAGALVWVMFAYSGWNASSYIAGNLEDPKRNLPYSLLVGTLIVTILYVLLNMVFLYVADFSELAGQVDVGNIVANKMMGEEIGLIFSAVFSIALISGINAMFIAGPRVGERMGKDYAQLNFLGKETPNGAPAYSILLLFVIASSLVVFSSFKDIIEYIAVTLSLFSLLVVGGVFILRRRKVDQEGVVRTWGYPVTPIIFIFFTCWMVYYFVSEDIWTLVYSLLTILSGVIIYLFLKRNEA
jgi:APA family basic amino acid/polyamine antiporter